MIITEELLEAYEKAKADNEKDIREMNEYLKTDYSKLSEAAKKDFTEIRERIKNSPLPHLKIISFDVEKEKAKIREEVSSELQKKADKKIQLSIEKYNKEVEKYNKEVEIKSEDVEAIIDQFVASITTSSEVNKYKKRMQSEACNNPEFVRGFLSAISAISNRDIGEIVVLKKKMPKK